MAESLMLQSPKYINMLHLDANFPRLPKVSKRRIEGVVYSTIQETTEQLHLPLTIISVDNNADYESGDASPYLMHEGKLVIGEIRLSRYWLSNIGLKMAIPVLGKIYENELRGALAHESYHLSEVSRFPNTYEERRLNEYNTARFWRIAHAGSRSEYAAELYTLSYLQKRRASSPSDFLGKKVVTAEQHLEVGLRKAWRSIRRNRIF